MRTDLNAEGDFSAQIAASIRDAIVSGKLMVDARLPSEAELAETFGVSRPTVREALKRLAAQSLIRTQRGATGGAFVNRVSFDEVQSSLITSSTLLLSMNAIDFETACEARYALERSCVQLAAERRAPDHLAAMRAEIARQATDGLPDTSFCASDVAFHRALVDALSPFTETLGLAGDHIRAIREKRAIDRLVAVALAGPTTSSLRCLTTSGTRLRSLSDLSLRRSASARSALLTATIGGAKPAR